MSDRVEDSSVLQNQIRITESKQHVVHGWVRQRPSLGRLGTRSDLCPVLFVIERLLEAWTAQSEWEPCVCEPTNTELHKAGSALSCRA